MSRPMESEPARLDCRAHSVAVQTADFDTAYTFYTTVLGLRTVREPFLFKTRTLAWLDGGGVLIELFSMKKGHTSFPYTDVNLGLTHIAFEVPDLDEAIELCKQHNVPITQGPMTPPSGDPLQPRVLFVEGPDGQAIQLREPRRDE
ncbi:VOC family protein [Nonomuraea sp. B10E15]|uniref:VOC family protein n=1 Tax=Nonomuraea sp. B10E15 TaxID=3153560 RepID=UPI00325D82E4